jgi:hypothetical protein
MTLLTGKQKHGTGDKDPFEYKHADEKMLGVYAQAVPTQPIGTHLI